jgi:hypothetical protein
MADDDGLIREIDEEYRRERLNEAWRNFGRYILAITAVILLTTISYVGWQEYRRHMSATLTTQLLQAEKEQQQKNLDSAELLLKNIAQEQHATIPPIAGLWLLQLEAEKKDPDFDAVQDFTPSLAPYDNYSQLIMAAHGTAVTEELVEPGKAFRLTAMEIEAVKALKAGNMNEAHSLFTSIAEAVETPDSMRQRATLLLDTVLKDAQENESEKQTSKETSNDAG